MIQLRATLPLAFAALFARPLAAQQAGSRDSVVYEIARASRLEVATGRSGLFSFAGHDHVVLAHGVSGRVVWFPATPAESRVELRVPVDSLEVTTPPDTAEIRKVTAAMRADVLHADRFHEIRFSSREVTPTRTGFHVVAALTLAGQTADVAMDVRTRIGSDTLFAATNFAVRQTRFGIQPYHGGPGGLVQVADRVQFTIDVVAVRVGR